MFVALLAIQFFHPTKNESGILTNDISTVYTVPADVQEILKTSCNDCHSNKTIYPWYTNIQPVDWFMADHVNEGKEEINFNEFASYRIFRQYKKMQEIMKEVKEGEMPLTSYTLIHGNAKLSETQKQTIINWAQGIADEMKAKYPADSLVNPKKRVKKDND